MWWLCICSCVFLASMNVILASSSSSKPNSSQSNTIINTFNKTVSQVSQVRNIERTKYPKYQKYQTASTTTTANYTLQWSSLTTPTTFDVITSSSSGQYLYAFSLSATFYYSQDYGRFRWIVCKKLLFYQFMFFQVQLGPKPLHLSRARTSPARVLDNMSILLILTPYLCSIRLIMEFLLLLVQIQSAQDKRGSAWSPVAAACMCTLPIRSQSTCQAITEV